MRQLGLLAAGLLLFAVVGCDGPADDTGTNRKDGADGEVGAETPAGNEEQPALAPDDIKLKVVDGEQYRAVLKQHAGKVLLVDYWALWCPPCKEKFPHIVELHEKHADQGLAVVSLSIDFPEDEPQVREFLAAQGAEFQNLLSKFGASTKSAEAYDFDGGVPLYKLYDRAGNLRYQFSGAPETLENGEPIENLDKRVHELLAKMPTP